MDLDQARWLVGPDARAALQRAAALTDPGSLAAAERMRRELSPDRAALVLAQEGLRRRAVTKFGEAGRSLFLTADGLEQATRPEVAAWRARRLADAGVRRVIDLGCGLGADALAFAASGLEVVAVEADPATAVLAGANLGREVIVGDAVELLDALVSTGSTDEGSTGGGSTAVFCDPARRTSSGRSWRVQDLNPPWSFVTDLLARHTTVVKLGPGLAHNLIPDGVAATWVSDGGDLVEVSLWSGRTPGRHAVLLPGDHVLDDGPAHPAAPGTPQPGEVLYEPDPAVIRAGLVDVLADGLGAHRISPGIAYLIGPKRRSTPFATAFEVLEVLDAGERTLRAWVRVHQVGTLEIKKRGLDVDPAVLRRRLKPSGPNSATIVLTPTSDGARAIVVSRF